MVSHWNRSSEAPSINSNSRVRPDHERALTDVRLQEQRELLERYEDQVGTVTFCRRGSLQVLTLDGTLPASARTLGDAILAIPCSGLRSLEE
jgi:hypothetical protein